MGKKIRKIYPSYFEEFKCIGGKCSDSCCIGWNIDIDKITFKRYFKVQDQEMKKMFQKNVQSNERCSSEEIDYGVVKLKKDKRCPFLDEENYCVIHSNLGEDYLSNVCTSFPRITNKIDDTYEMSLDISCPEAARIILLKEEGIKFDNSKGELGKHILSNVIETKASLKYIKDVRDYCIGLIQDRKFSLNERLYALGDFTSNLEDKINNNEDITKYINDYKVEGAVHKYNDADINDLLGNSYMNYIIKMNFFIKMLKILKVDKEVESQPFKAFTKEMLDGFNISKLEGSGDISENVEFYIQGYKEYECILKEYDYIIENYLVNFIYNYMFPFNEVLSIFDSYIMLLMRVGFIKFYLVGIYLKNKNVDKNRIVEFVQVFSKTIEHHRSYLMDSLQYVKRNDYDNLEFAKSII